MISYLMGRSPFPFRTSRYMIPLSIILSFGPLYLLEGLLAGLDGPIQIFLVMGQRDKPSFKLGRWKINPLLHHFDEELGESFRITHLCRSIISHWAFCKKEGEHPFRVIDREGYSFLFSDSGNIFCKVEGLFLQILIYLS